MEEHWGVGKREGKVETVVRRRCETRIDDQLCGG